MAIPTTDVLPVFEDLVRDCLLHLYDPGHLHAHQILDYAPADRLGTASRGKALRQALLDAVETLRPGPGVVTLARAWRAYHILELRYIEGHDVADVIDQVALSKSQYHREHQRALQAVASVLWERWGLDAAALRDPGVARDAGLARAEAQQLAQERAAATVNPHAVAEGVLQLVRPLCLQRRINLRLAFVDDIPDLRGDRVALRHALLTLLIQAIQRSEPGELALDARAAGGEIELALTGRWGNAAEAFRLDESRPFVEALGGRLTCAPATAPGDQWRIHLVFPADSRPTLLVVDNNAEFIRLVERYLAGQEWRMIGAADVAQAFTLAAQRQPRAILLDVVIPGRDGWELLQDLKMASGTRNIPVGVCSVLHEPDIAISLGATSYLSKPISQNQLLAWLGSLPVNALPASSSTLDSLAEAGA